MSVVLHLGADQIALFREAYPRLVQRAIYRAVRRIEAMAKEETPIRKRAWEPGGTLQQTIRVWDAFDSVNVEWPAPYAEYVDKGAGPHKMMASPGRPMRWQDPFGVWHSAYEVDHPGQRPQRFVDRVGERAIQILKEELHEVLIQYELAQTS